MLVCMMVAWGVLALLDMVGRTKATHLVLSVLTVLASVLQMLVPRVTPIAGVLCPSVASHLSLFLLYLSFELVTSLQVQMKAISVFE